MGVGCSVPELGQGLLRGAVRACSLEEAGQALKSSAKWLNLPPETIKQPLLAGPRGLTQKEEKAPSTPQGLGWQELWEAWLLCLLCKAGCWPPAPEGLTLL